MTDKCTGRKAGGLCALAVFTLLLVVLPALGFDFYYDLNDDTLIKDIVSGAYTGSPSGYGVQLLYPLSWLISLMYRAVPGFSWYGLFLCVCQFGTAVLIAVRLTKLFRSVRAGAAALFFELLIFFGLFFRELVIVQYSVTAGFCMAGAIFLFITSDKRKNAVPVLLVLLAFLIRTEICLLLLPFLLSAGLFCLVSEEKLFTRANFRNYFLPVCAAALGALILYGIDALAYSGGGWSGFRDFFDARTTVYDFYGLPDYEENRAFYESVGLSEESYALLENYNFALDDSINAWLLEEIAAYQKQQLHSTLGFVSKNSVREALWLYRNRFLSGASAADFAAAASYAFYLFLALVPAAKGRRLREAAGRILPKIALLLVIRSVLWLYLYMVDRVLSRVTTPLFMAELACVWGFCIVDLRGFAGRQAKTASKTIKRAAWAAYFLAAAGLTAAAFGGVRSVKAEYAARARADERWNALAAYCSANAENYYIIDVYSSTSYEGASYSEKIFKNADNSYKNFDICGGWLAKSPLAQQKLLGEGYKDVQNALLEENVYFVAAADKDLTWLEAYYAKRGTAAVCARADEICTDDGDVAFAVYRMIMEENYNETDG